MLQRALWRCDSRAKGSGREARYGLAIAMHDAKHGVDSR